MEDSRIPRQDLERQITDLEKQIKFLKSQSSFQKLIELEKYTETILNNMGDSVFVKDIHSKIVFANDACCKFFNLPRNKIIGQTLSEYVPLKERESFMKIDKQVLEEGRENIHEETFTFGNAPTLYISTRKSRFIDSTGNKYLVGVIRDITKSKEAEFALKKSETKLKELNASKDKFFSIISHDLKSPLNNVIGFCNILADEAKSKNYSNIEMYTEIIQQASKKSIDLLENLIKWSQTQTNRIKFNPELIEIGDVIKKTIELSQYAAFRKSINLSIKLPGKAPLLADKVMFETIMRNLISNSIKYSNQDGSIEVEVKPKRNEYLISVCDNGIGMKSEVSNKLFKMNSGITTVGTNNETGTGLGLIICKDFVERHRGKIWVESEYRKGSTFYVSLPLN